MSGYRCYLCDGRDKIRAVETAECATDAETFVRAAALLEEHDTCDSVEIWNGSRLVGRVPRAQQSQSVA
jgi:hypothetical protein